MATLEQRRAYRQAYRAALRASGGRRVDLVIDGRLDARLRVFLAGYGYETHPGHAIGALLDELAPVLPRGGPVGG